MRRNYKSLWGQFRNGYTSYVCDSVSDLKAHEGKVIPGVNGCVIIIPEQVALSYDAELECVGVNKLDANKMNLQYSMNISNVRLSQYPYKDDLEILLHENLIYYELLTIGKFEKINLTSPIFRPVLIEEGHAFEMIGFCYNYENQKEGMGSVVQEEEETVDS